MNMFIVTHQPSPLLVEAIQREVLGNSGKFFKLFRERCEKKGPFVSQLISRFVFGRYFVKKVCDDANV